MEAFVTSLVERIPNKDSEHMGKLSLVRVMTMDKRNAPKHPEGNIRKRGRVRLFEAFKRSLKMEDTRRHPINKMSGSQNCIPPQVRRMRGRQHQR